MTRYVLPAILGGQELDGEDHGDGVILDVPGYGNLLMPAHYVTEVKPLPPPEPADRVHVVCNGYVFTRRDDTAKARYPLQLGRCWFDGSLEGMTWPEVLAYSEAYSCPLVRLVPDPADTAPALPWNVQDNDEDSLVIQDADAKGIAAMVSVNSESVYLSPAVAREAARVLLRAAREFEEREAGAVVSETAREVRQS